MSNSKIIIKTTKANRFGKTININNVNVAFDKKGFAEVDGDMSVIVDNDTIFLSNAERATFQTKDELIEELKLTIKTLSDKLAESAKVSGGLITSNALLEAENLKYKTDLAGKAEATSEEAKAPKALSKMNKAELEAVATEMKASLPDFDLDGFTKLNKNEMVLKLESLLS